MRWRGFSEAWGCVFSLRTSWDSPLPLFLLRLSSLPKNVSLPLSSSNPRGTTKLSETGISLVVEEKKPRKKERTDRASIIPHERTTEKDFPHTTTLTILPRISLSFSLPSFRKSSFMKERKEDFEGKITKEEPFQMRESLSKALTEEKTGIK